MVSLEIENETDHKVEARVGVLGEKHPNFDVVKPHSSHVTKTSAGSLFIPLVGTYCSWHVRMEKSPGNYVEASIGLSRGQKAHVRQDKGGVYVTAVLISQVGGGAKKKYLK